MVVGTTDKKKNPVCKIGLTHHRIASITSKGKARKFHNKTKRGSCIGLQDCDSASFERPKPWKAKMTAMSIHLLDSFREDTLSIDCAFHTASPKTSTKPKINPYC